MRPPEEEDEVARTWMAGMGFRLERSDSCLTKLGHSCQISFHWEPQMDKPRNPDLFASPRFRPFERRDSRPRREVRPTRNARFVPESLEYRLSPTDLTGAAVVSRTDAPPPSAP